MEAGSFKRANAGKVVYQNLLVKCQAFYCILLYRFLFTWPLWMYRTFLLTFTFCYFVLALSESECELWVKGLKYLARDAISAPYPLQVQRWLWKEFRGMANGRETATLKDVKAFLPQVNCKMPNPRLKDAFQEVNNRRSGELCFNEFSALYTTLIHDDNVNIYPCLLFRVLMTYLMYFV